MHPSKEILTLVGFFVLIAIVLCYFTAKGTGILP